MGNFLAKMMGKLFNFTQSKRILMVGLDAAGKTTILYKMKLGEQIHTIPTIGFNVETVQYKNIEFTMWDVGGQEKIRPLWKHYYSNTDAVIWVVDSADKERIEESIESLHHILEDDEMRNASLLVFANKQDLPAVMPVEELSERLGLHKMRGRDWFIQAAVATKGEGLYEGLEWLSANLKSKKSSR